MHGRPSCRQAAPAASFSRQRPEMEMTNNPQLRAGSSTLALECRALRKQYGARRIVHDHLDFMLAPGEYVAIMGESGVGKSAVRGLGAGRGAPGGGGRRGGGGGGA